MIIVSALSLSLRDKDRFRDRESLTINKFFNPQVVAIFALFGVLLLVVAPVILAVSPVFLCCKYDHFMKNVQILKLFFKLTKKKNMFKK